jgi:Peptidase inhibitor I78 family
MIRTALLPLSMLFALSACAQSVQNDGTGDTSGGQAGGRADDAAGAAADDASGNAGATTDAPAPDGAAGGGAVAGGAPPVAATPEEPQIRVSPGLEQSCDAAPAQHLVGRSNNDAAVRDAMKLTGAKAVRVIPHDGMVTMDYRGDRLNIQLDEQGKILAITCG